MKNLAHSASLDSEDKDAPSKPGIKHLSETKERPKSKFHFDLDLSPEAIDASRIQGELVYPEWIFARTNTWRIIAAS
nr:hypothetical protein [Rhizobium laguerreae]